MKTMTCNQLGGPCDVPFNGNTADDVIKAQDTHLKEMVAKGDTNHKNALEMMQARWKNPLKGMSWYIKTQREFAALSEEK